MKLPRATHLIVMVKSAKAAQRVMASVIRYCEGRLRLVINRAKSKTAPLKSCAFLGYQIDGRGKLVWTLKALARFKERVREPERSGDRLPQGSPEGVSETNQITRRHWGHRVQDVIDELRLYVLGWLNYYRLSATYTVVLELAEWLRRRVRLYYCKQWKQPRTRRRNLLALGIFPDRVKLASRSRKGYWRMSRNSIVQTALSNRWLEERGVPDMRAKWIALHYGPKARV